MPSASNTRSVAALMFGAIAGCTQPASISILRGCGVPGVRPACCAAGTLAFNEAGSSGRASWPSFIAGPNSGLVSPAFSAPRTRRAPNGRGTCSSTTLRPMSTSRPYCTPDGQVVSQLRQVRHRSR